MEHLIDTAGDGGNPEQKTLVGQRDSAPPTPPAKIDLRDAHAIRRELGQVYRDARAGRIKTQEATRLAYLLELLRKAYESCELQRRLELLELTVRERKVRNEA